MHMRSSNTKLLTPLVKPEGTLNRRLRRNKRYLIERKDERPENPREIYPPILDITHFLFFLKIIEFYDPMANPDDEPMWAADCLVAPTLGSSITIPATANEFELLISCHGHGVTKDNIIKIFYHGLDETTQEALNAAAGGIFLYKTPDQAYQLLKDKVLLILDWDKNQKPKTPVRKTVAFPDEGNSNSDTDKIMARIDAMALKWMLSIKK
ncbi:hypothetical protein Tco_1522358 [Tanacetum coccineum]